MLTGTGVPYPAYRSTIITQQMTIIGMVKALNSAGHLYRLTSANRRPLNTKQQTWSLRVHLFHKFTPPLFLWLLLSPKPTWTPFQQENGHLGMRMTSFSVIASDFAVVHQNVFHDIPIVVISSLWLYNNHVEWGSGVLRFQTSNIKRFWAPICVYVHIYIYIYICTINMYIYTYIDIYIDYICMCIYVCVYTYV